MLKGQIKSRISVEDGQLIHDLAFLKKKKLSSFFLVAMVKERYDGYYQAIWNVTITIQQEC